MDYAELISLDGLSRTLSLRGIDTQHFKGHSTQSALTSKIALSSLILSDILARGQWSRESTKLNLLIGVEAFHASVAAMKNRRPALNDEFRALS